jgi:Oxidoreductase NAD-binding domain
MIGAEGELKTVRLWQAFTPGATLLSVVAVGNVVLWMLARPPDQPTGRYVARTESQSRPLAGSGSLARPRELRALADHPPADGPVRGRGRGARHTRRSRAAQLDPAAHHLPHRRRDLAPAQRRLEVAIKAVGDYTRDLHDTLRPGTPAKAAGPFGGFDYRHGGQDQIWIAGGFGITPFMSWIRSLEATSDRHVDFYYSVAREEDALYLDEIDAAGAQHQTIHPHIVYTDRDELLTARQAVDGRPRGADVWIYLCGPPAMAAALAREFRGLGIPASHVQWEHFDAR